MKTQKKLAVKSAIKTKAVKKQPKFYTAEKQGSRYDVLKSLLESKQLKLNTVYTSDSIENLEVKLYGQKDKVKNLSSYKMYIPLNRDTHKSLKSENHIDIEAIDVKKGKAIKFKFVACKK